MPVDWPRFTAGLIVFFIGFGAAAYGFATLGVTRNRLLRVAGVSLGVVAAMTAVYGIGTAIMASA